MVKTLRFKTKAGYKKWVTYGHIHKVFKEEPPYTKIIIHGKKHKVRHHKKNLITSKKVKW